MRVLVGGTFEFMHLGHRKLIERAFEIGDYVTIGITADGFKSGVSRNYAERKRLVENFARQFKKRYQIVEIYDIYGPSLEDNYDAIVVSPETYKNAVKINRKREKIGLKPMKIVTIPMVFAEDLIPISSSRIKKGKIDEMGKRLKPLMVHIGSENPSKVNSVKNVFSKLFSFDIEFVALRIDSGVPAQPFEDDTVRGAINRAKKALGNADYSVGIEAGLFYERVIEKYVDRAYCAIMDEHGLVTVGHSGGFYYPPYVMELVNKGMEVGEAMELISGIKEIKKGMGAIGYLSKGHIKRVEFNAQAVLMAMIPRLSHELYF